MYARYAVKVHQWQYLRDSLLKTQEENTEENFERNLDSISGEGEMMKDTVVKYLVKPEDAGLKNPVLVEGLPGIGHVGKLVAEHLIKELKAKKIIEIYSPHFPPQVIVNEDGTITMVRNEIYAWKSDGRAPDLLILVGDYQSVTNEGHYELTGIYIDIAKKFGVKRIYTLGGYGIGKFVEEPFVLGAANSPSLVEEMISYGVEFRNSEPGGGIIGASGLLLGFAQEEGIEAVCLMGVTSGYMVDPKSAQAVLRVLMKALNLDVRTEELERRAEEMERIISRLKETESQLLTPQYKRDEDLRYFG